MNFSDRRYGYDGNDSEPDTMPPPCVCTSPPHKDLTLTALDSYTEHDPKPPKSLPQMQTSRRGPLKQAAKRGSYAYLGGGPALSTYRPNMAQSLVPPTPRVSTPQSIASRGGGRGLTPKPTPSRTPTSRRQSSPTKPSSALSNTATTSESDQKSARKKCSQCRISGHDTRNCPLNRYGLGKSSTGTPQGLPQQGFREMSETTTTMTKTTTKHSKSSSVLDGRVSKPKATPKTKGMGKK